jgi:hypothetical protein
MHSTGMQRVDVANDPNIGIITEMSKNRCSRRLAKDRWIAFFYRCIAQVITGYYCKSLMSVEDIEATQQEDLTFVVQDLFLIQRTR